MLLLFRWGDFCRAFAEDAVAASDILGLHLVCVPDGKGSITFTGVPVHALDKSLPKLVEAGHKVGVIDQDLVICPDAED